MLYIVGVGPGDPELITVKAANCMNSADILYIPASDAEGRDIVLNILNTYNVRAEIRSYNVLSKDPEAFMAEYRALAAEMNRLVTADKNIAYLTPGDATLYSSAALLCDCLDEHSTAYDLIPGIPSFLACANQSKQMLTVNRESFTLQLLPDNSEDIKDAVDKSDTAVFMRLSKHLNALFEYIAVFKPYSAKLVHKVGLKGECVIDLLQTHKPKPEWKYLSVVIIKKEAKK